MDFLSGGDGSDTYVFTRGDGRDRIEDNGFNDTDRIEINGYTPAEVILSGDVTGSSGGDDLRITFVGTDDQLIVYNTLNGSSIDQIEQIAFEDGTVWTPADVLALLTPSVLNEVNGTNDPETLVNTLANDLLSGGGGSDIYEFTAGDGQDFIDENGVGNTDRLLIHGYDPVDVSIQQGTNGAQSLLLTFAGSSDEITILNTLAGDFSDEVEQIEFDDGTIWTMADVRAQLLAADIADGDGFVTGSAYAETIIAGAGDQLISGGSGSDIYEFTAGDGQDVIDENGFDDTDRLLIHGYDPVDVSIQQGTNGAQSLLLTFAGSDDQITILNTLAEDFYDEIESIEFDDGTIWTMADVRAQLLAADIADGDGSVTGSGFAETINAGTGDHLISGGDGSDIYEFTAGDGQDIIDENGFFDTDRLIIHGYDPVDVSVQQGTNGAQSLLLTFAGSDDEITILNTLAEDAYDQVEQIEFDDGTIWTMADVRAQLLAADIADGDGTVTGSGYAETIIAGAGDQLISGGDGSDTYEFTAGDGQDIIDENGFGDTDRLLIHGYDPVDVSVQQGTNGAQSLLLTFAGSSDQITILNTLAGDFYDEIELIEFDDGTIWAMADVRAQLLAADIADGDGSVIGSGYAETIIAGAGDQLIRGGDGSDIYEFTAGDGQDIIDENGFGDTDRLLIHGYDPVDVLVQQGTNGAQSLLLTFAGSTDQITVLNTLAEDVYDGIERIEFDDGTIWTMADVRAQLLAVDIADGDGFVTGTGYAETLIAGAGDQFISGGDGSDVYEFTAGDGQDIIDENGFGDTDRLLIHGYDPVDVFVEQGTNGAQSLLLTFAGSDDQITILNTLAGDVYDQIERIEFDDGTIWTMADVLQILGDGTITAVEDERYEVTGGQEINIPVAELLGNDNSDGSATLVLAGVSSVLNGVAVINEDGTIGFTPTEGFFGTASFVYHITDGENRTSSATVEIEVIEQSEVLITALDIPDQVFLEDQSFNFAIDPELFDHADGNSLVFSAELAGGKPLPDWLLFDPATMEFVGTPPADSWGKLPLQITASDGTSSIVATFIMSLTAINDAPVAAQSLEEVVLNPGDVTILLPDGLFTDVDNDDETLIVSANLTSGDDLPSWLSFDGSVFSGISPEGFTGTLEIEVVASDGELTTSEVFTLSIDTRNLIQGTAEADRLIGSGDPDVLIGGAGNDLLRGGEGADDLRGGSGIDKADYRQSTDGVSVDLSSGTGSGGDAQDDTLSGIEHIYGSDGGDDVLTGDSGDNDLFGYAGSDMLIGGAGDDRLRGFDGDDEMHGGSGQDRLIGMNDNDTMYGDDGNDAMQGGDGNDIMFGGADDDYIVGGAGNDEMHGGIGNDTLHGRSGVDSIYGDEGDDILRGDSQTDMLYGGDDNDYIDAAGGADIAEGGAGADTILGGGGSDIITGGTGNDVTDGGVGNNTFVFNTDDGADRIRDWSLGNNRIDFSGNAHFNSFADVQAAMVDQTNGHLRIDFNADNEILLLNTLSSDLDASDFIF